MKTIHTLCLFVCICLFTNAQQQEHNFSLDEAIIFALDSSYTAINARKEVAKALKRKWEVTANGLPQISGQIEYLNNLKQRTSVIPGGFSGNTEAASIPVTFGTKQQASVGATLTQLIFDGSYLVGVEASSVFVNFTKTQKEKQDLQIIEGVTNTYGSVLLAQENINIVKNNISALEKNLNETTEIYKNGLIEEENVEQLQITLLQLQNQLNNLEKINSLALQMLNLSIGIPIESKTKLTNSLEELVITKETENLESTNFQLSNNNDFKVSELLVEQRRLELKLERSLTLPKLGAFVDIGTQSFDNDFNFLKHDQPWFFYTTIGGRVNIPLFSAFKSRVRIKQAELTYEQAKNSHQRNQQQIELAYQEAKSNFNFAANSLATSNQSLKLAERIEKKNQLKFKEGIASSFELRQAQTQLYSAQQQQLDAQLKVIQSATKLQTIINIKK